VEAVLAASRKLADRLLAETARPGFVEGLPGLKAAEEVLEQARNELEYARNQQRPHVALTGSLEMFQVDDIGYESLGNALQRNFVEPDGVIWSVGVAGSLPLGSADRARRDAANRRMRAAEADLAATRRDLLQQSRALAARLRAAGEAVEAAREHVRAAAALLEEHATPLYEARRLTRAEHAAFAADLESNRLGFTSACRDYLAALIELAAFAGTPLDPVRTALH
jgi:outer membrane protein TolC